MPQVTNTKAHVGEPAGTMTPGVTVTLELPETCGTLLHFVNTQRQNLGGRRTTAGRSA